MKPLSLISLVVLLCLANLPDEELQAEYLVKRTTIPMVETAVGTVESRNRVVISSQINGQILKLPVDAGVSVVKGEVVAELDDREVKARFEQAASKYERIKRLLEKKAATAEQMEEADSAYIQAKTTYGYSKIESPIDGIVSERMVQAGDLAWPGRGLLVVYDPTSLRLEAVVREGLVGSLKKGSTYKVQLPSVGQVVEGTLSEIVPSADPASRSFNVRVNFESTEGVYPGMFGRLLFEVGQRQAILIPNNYIVSVGQLKMVLVAGEKQERRSVVTGELGEEGLVEILSGLDGTETLVDPSSNK